MTIVTRVLWHSSIRSPSKDLSSIGDRALRGTWSRSVTTSAIDLAPLPQSRGKLRACHSPTARLVVNRILSKPRSREMLTRRMRNRDPRVAGSALDRPQAARSREFGGSALIASIERGLQGRPSPFPVCRNLMRRFDVEEPRLRCRGDTGVRSTVFADRHAAFRKVGKADTVAPLVPVDEGYVAHRPILCLTPSATRPNARTVRSGMPSDPKRQ